MKKLWPANSFPNIGNIIVAVIDNGVYSDHEDLPLHTVGRNAHTGRSPAGLYGDHGTMVAGVIGATANNNKGVAGVAAGVKIMPISVCYTDDGRRLGISASTSSHFANALRWAADNGARVINNSWSFKTSSPMPDINDAVRYAQNKGCVVVFCSMNENGPVLHPAAGVPETIVVGAISPSGIKASFSNFGASLDVVAPGEGIWTTNWTGGYSSGSGTSYAAPFVSGVAALVLSVNPNLTGAQVRNLILDSAVDVRDDIYSYGGNKTNGLWVGGRLSGIGLYDKSVARRCDLGKSDSENGSATCAFG